MSCVCAIKFKFGTCEKFKAKHNKVFDDLDFEQQRKSRNLQTSTK
jgi:hypothetical protein